MKITSSVFEENKAIPREFTCDEENINPPLLFQDVARNAQSLALVVDDPDAPGDTFVHWVLYNINPKEKGIGDNSIPPGAVQGKNGIGVEKYMGPCPPSGVHHYHFKLYALDTMIDSNLILTKEELELKMQGHILDQTELVGLYSRHQ